MVNVMKIAFGIGIAIILFLVVILGIQTFYPSPEHEDYCGEQLYLIDNEAECIAEGGEWSGEEDIVTDEGDEGVQIVKIEECNPPRECYEELDEARDDWGKVVFFVASLIGLIFVVVSLFLMKMPNISGGIAFSGIALFVYAFIVGWEGTDDVWKFSMGIIIAALLILFAVMINKKYNKD